jgi:hypothetical protein
MAGAPAWAKPMPPGLVVPQGRLVVFVRFRKEWTDNPYKGARQCVLWPISAGDKRFAIGRAMGDSNRAADELAKQMIRAFDDSEDSAMRVIDDAGTGDGGQIEVFWNEIGERCRGLLVRAFSQLHYLKTGEMADFLDNCIAVRGVVAGS